MRVGDVVPVVPMEHLLRNEYKCSAPKRMVWAKLSEIRVKIIHSSNIYEPFPCVSHYYRHKDTAVNRQEKFPLL